MRRVIAGGLVVTNAQPLIAVSGSVVIEDGLIAAVVDRQAWSPGHGDEVVDARGCIVLPGLFNCHVHSGVAPFRGLFEDMTLLELNQDDWLAELSGKLLQDQQAQLVCSEWTYLECLRSGATFVCDVPLGDLGRGIIDVFKRVGVRGAVIENTELESDYLRSQCGALQRAGLQPQLWIHSEAKTSESSNFTDAHLATTLHLTQELGVGTHMHLAETDWRDRAIRTRYGTSAVEILDRNGLLGPKFVGAHGIYLTDDDMSRLSQTGAKLVACPTAEMKLGDGVSDLRSLRAASVPVGLGTDGAIYNNTNDLFAEMKMLCMSQKLHFGPTAINAAQALWMATGGGAQVFDRQELLGTLSEGKLADIVLIDATHPSMQPVLTTPMSNVANNVVYSGSAHLVRAVLVEGEIVVEQGRHQTVDEPRLRGSLNEVVGDLLGVSPFE